MSTRSTRLTRLPASLPEKPSPTHRLRLRTSEGDVGQSKQKKSKKMKKKTSKFAKRKVNVKCAMVKPSDRHQTHTSLLNDFLSSTEASDYLHALSSDTTRLIPQQFTDDESSSTNRVYSKLLHRVESFLVSESEDDEDKANKVLLMISIVLATFLASLSAT
nr:hypothetical protein CFP56_60916 [Quercus suber]